MLTHPTKCAIQSTLFTLQNCPFNTSSLAARPTPNNGRTTVNDELGRIWKETMVVYDAFGDCVESQISFSLDNKHLDHKTKLRLPVYEAEVPTTIRRVTG
jgi:hypothetical protein